MNAALANSDIGQIRALIARWRNAKRGLIRLEELEEVLDGIEARRAEGGDLLCADVRGDSVPELHARALMKAADLWGLDASCAVEKTGTVRESLRTDRGRYCAEVYVRCLNYAEISREPGEQP